jgi:hypothetical protein
MWAVVLPDGTVGDVTVLQSLDPHFGLDEAAVETASGASPLHCATEFPSRSECKSNFTSP